MTIVRSITSRTTRKSGSRQAPLNSSPPQAYRGGLLSFREDPDKAGSDAYQYWEDGLMLVEGGLIRTLGSASELLGTLPPDTRVIDHRGKLILPGFIDTHIHYPQTGVIGAYGAQLMDWLKQYTFPAEQRFSDRQHAQQVARFSLMNCCVTAPPPHWFCNGSSRVGRGLSLVSLTPAICA